MSDQLVDIMVVDDDRIDLEIITRVMKQVMSAVSVHAACGGPEALDELFSSGGGGQPAVYPRLILLDLKMPEQDGIEVLRSIRADARTRCIPVIMLSASVSASDVSSCYRAGANGYLRKECSHESLREMLSTICSFWLRHNRVAEAELVRG